MANFGQLNERFRLGSKLFHFLQRVCSVHCKFAGVNNRHNLDSIFRNYTLVLSSTLMLYTTKAKEAIIVDIEATPIIPNIFSPFYHYLN
jgi:hypothetical protein